MHSLCSSHDVVLCLVLGELYFPFSFGFGCVFRRRERLKCWHCCTPPFSTSLAIHT